MISGFRARERLAVSESETPGTETQHAHTEVLSWDPKERKWYFAVKRSIDVTLAALAMIVLLPVIIGIVLLILLDTAWPVIYKREVIGQHGRLFHMIKFRTMKVGAEQELVSNPDLYKTYQRQNYKLRSDPRVTRIGRILRKYSLDELPQLWNVLRGQMSLVGPRSIPLSELGEFGEFARLRHCIRPGITGLWQVSGRADTSYAQRVQLDYHYVQTCSLRLDLLILFQTPLAVLRGVGAY
ncbi:MAG TPA: sugar transferase [Ktedonobacterales bacterium]|nr:sugar transferase [Ktedonobacterales bacterium]